jgi:tetratricopeptide (TPR) repeat protein
MSLVCVLALEDHDSPDVAASYGYMGVVLAGMGKYEEALEMHTKSLEIDIHGDSHPLVAESFNNQEAFSGSKGDLDNALIQFQRALETRVRT